MRRAWSENDERYGTRRDTQFVERATDTGFIARARAGRVCGGPGARNIPGCAALDCGVRAEREKKPGCRSDSCRGDAVLNSRPGVSADVQLGFTPGQDSLHR